MSDSLGLPRPPRKNGAHAGRTVLYADTPDSDGNDRRCPDGTVPVRHVSVDDMKRFDSLQHYLAKNPRGDSGLPEKPPSNQGHQYAVPPQIGLSDFTAAYGIESNLNLWKTAVADSTEFSLSQVWVVGNPNARGTLQTAEAGVQVYPQKYGDQLPRLFIYFTPDNYGSGGCYNEDCGTFVQTNSSIYIGGPFSSYSTLGGAQYEVRINIQPNVYGDWWVGVQGTWVGYWPFSAYWPGPMAGGASYVEVGGEMTTAATHSRTQMGSGSFPCQISPVCGFNNCCNYYANYGNVMYQRRVVTFDSANRWYYASVTPGGWSTNTSCYSFFGANSSDSYWGDNVSFGGFGKSTYCP